MTPTAEQFTIIEFGKSSNQSLIINALAGAAKTSTLVMLAHALPPQPILCLAFNKRIADEMQKRMPGHVMCQTLNSLGHRAWSRVIGKKLLLNTSKTYELVKEEIEFLKGEDKKSMMEQFGSLIRGVSAAKLNGFVPKSYYSISDSLISEEDLDVVLDAVMDEAPGWKERELIIKVLEESIKIGYAGGVDFDDQIYLSTLFGKTFPKFPVVMGDEIQDFSPLNHKMLEELHPGRFIGVGDPWQSIYAFRGADRHSMAKLKKQFGCAELTLSVSFRCPISAVKRAWFRVPHMKWWDTAEEGTITKMDKWSVDDIPENSAIICRNNAPLFSCALSFIKAGRGVTVVGRELGPGLIKILRKLGPPDLPKDRVLIAIKAWENENIEKASQNRKAVVTDKADCLRIFAEFGSTLDEAISYAEHLFSSEGSIKLLSGHKAKGLEFDNVVHLDSWRIPSKWARLALETGNEGPMDQEMNLRYVIETRWKKHLILADLENLQ